MPRATANTGNTKRFELKTLPEGYVVLRGMTFGEIQQRRSAKMTIDGSAKNKNDMKAEMELINQAATRFSFAKCIVEHNLEDETGRTLDFNRPVDFDSLEARVGQEIEALIDDMNNFEEEEDPTVA